MKKRDLSDLYNDKLSEKEVNLIKWTQYFDNLRSPISINEILSIQEQQQLYDTARNLRGQYTEQQKDMIFNQIMTSHGFTRFTSGTNRVIYSLPQYPQILFKVAYDIAGCDDSPREFINQQLFKPYVPKILEVNYLGNIAITEKIIAFSKFDQFANCTFGPGGIYYIIRNVLIKGKYAVSDFGIKNWANWGYREGFGPVLLDFPYVYEVDPNKVWCTNTKDGVRCTGKYSYDERFEKIVCSKCGAVILPSALSSGEYYNSANVGKANIISDVKGDFISSDTGTDKKMKLIFKRNGEVERVVTTATKINYI